MGYYIDPENGQNKEQWLQDNGLAMQLKTPTNVRQNVEGTECGLVCLIDNGWMTAAGIAYDLRELNVFAEPDGRPKAWIWVPIEKLKPFCSRLEEPAT